MGADVPDRDIEEILSALGFQPVRKGAGNAAEAFWECAQPSWRRDVARSIDLIEEIARHYGYDKFPPRLPATKQPAHRLPHAAAQDRLRERLIALGYQEIVSIPLVDDRRDEIFRAPGVAPAVIGNPLAEDASVMRSTGIVGMIGALEWNLNHGQRNLRLFEIGKAYELRSGEPVETPVLTMGASGLARAKTIYEPAREFKFEDLKGDLDRIGELAGGFSWQPNGPAWMAGTRAARISLSKLPMGSLMSASGSAGQLAQRVADQLKLRQPIFLAELQLAPLLTGIETEQATRRFSPIPRFPAVERDFSLVLPDGVAFAQVAAVIGALRIRELRAVEPADLFRGGQIPAGRFSLMIRVTFQSMETTLTDAQVTEFSSRIVAALEKNLGAALRVS
jgi:phenylalanyl-tRNA synthetase beta chain